MMCPYREPKSDSLLKSNEIIWFGGEREIHEKKDG